MPDNALHTHTGGTDANIARLIDGGLLAVQGPGPLDIRTGVLIGPGSRTLVTGTADTGPMTVAIAAHHWVTSRGAANGAYRGVKVASSKATIAAAPGAGAGTRIDVVYVKQQDETPTVPSKDGTTAPLYSVLQGNPGAGKPDLSTIVGAEELATVEVSAGATSTNGANVLITNTARQTVARGVPIPVSSKAERDALEKFIGLTVKRLDDGGREERYTGTGSIWASPSDVPVLANVAARDTYFTGNLRAGAQALVGGNQHIYDGSGWHWSRRGFAELTSDAGGNIIVPHGLGAIPVGVLITPGAQLSVLLQNIVDLTWTGSADGINFVVQVRRDDTNAALPNQTVRFSWQAFV